MKYVVNVCICLVSVIVFRVIADTQCTQYNHSVYGQKGQCIPTSDCPGNEYVSGKCPSYPNNVKCCFTADNDHKCAVDYHNDYGTSGICINTSKCPGNKYKFNFCPTYGNSVKCCYTVGTDSACATYNDPGNNNIAGQCIEESKCNGPTISNLCPSYGATIKCCFSPPDPCESVTIVTRNEWEAVSATETTLLTVTPVPYIFIHHTTGSTCMTKASCIDKAKSVQKYHMYSKLWSDIGYSFLVGGDGTIYEGRGWDREGAHTKGYNSKALAFSFIGDFTSSLPTDAAIVAAKNAIRCGVSTNKIKADYILQGHRDAKRAVTTCPGNTLYEEIKGWARYTS